MGLSQYLVDVLSMFIPLKREPPLSTAVSRWLAEDYPKVSLDAAGLVALADLTTVARRTALTGTSCLLDALVLCPGLHKQQNAPELNGGEYPACAAMTTGYCFRVENPATVLYLQKVGRTGRLTTVEVSSPDKHQRPWRNWLNVFYDYGSATLASTFVYSVAVAMTLSVILLTICLGDWWALLVLGMLILSRLMNILVIRRRAALGWKGASEPGVKGDLLILLSQDRWVRMRGLVDDLKAVTSGQWLREPTMLENALVAFATLLVYLDAALAGNAKQESKLLLVALLFCSVGLLGIANESTKSLKMHERLIRVKHISQSYGRRLDLANQLIKESGRADWAVSLGMIVPQSDEKKSTRGPVTM
ncbi:hypothetical protein D0869_08754 [Hortaea werneckii]|uniref:Uncharacterized protein n=2 Tax=Hortaea werneckii TaxID=91943 RepID=A0A3M6Y2H4_HORWE|nr:hypothetical protein KC334_g16376 [Hortaea werneckii]KAI6931426.1 hypothetical protein KC355_g16300 [Hortaea werneckii]KAI7175743.1 hypothetical protein KC324_g10003 [Hortaea werneckii]KAI7582752.1 hypothetical protein KC316_g7683 [Hortaea werneckii]KAI7648700.1 hypothetical protein KC318_g17776 [Hortaea werneckii]